MTYSVADNIYRVSGSQLFAKAFRKPYRVERHRSLNQWLC